MWAKKNGKGSNGIDHNVSFELENAFALHREKVASIREALRQNKEAPEEITLPGSTSSLLLAVKMVLTKHGCDCAECMELGNFLK